MRLIRRKLIRKPRYLPITAIQVQKKLNEYNGKQSGPISFYFFLQALKDLFEEVKMLK